ncbi:hypothetical protein FE257_005473 [Aspergillus nanangensis]|uniref:Uncharacterized protein n=1 Tax=Aspergillus nanangensis TaxID=2582783 RepID=A0AAD4CSH5_ASPNN|nr:hypothetical protein FE257_005473 [Aspergillus nanangensis]
MTPLVEYLVSKFLGQEAAQSFRRRRFMRGATEKYKDDAAWARDMITMHMELCEMSQREGYLRQEARELQERAANSAEGLTTSQQSQLEKWLGEIEQLARQYWIREREFYRREVSAPSGPVLRGYLSWRENPRWYMLSKTLTRDCAGRGGCCGRACGCCDKDRMAGRKVRKGHCTVECGCCRRVWGFEMSYEDKTRYKKLYDVHMKENEAYVNRLKMAYIFGK